MKASLWCNEEFYFKKRNTIYIYCTCLATLDTDPSAVCFTDDDDDEAVLHHIIIAELHVMCLFFAVKSSSDNKSTFVKKQSVDELFSEPKPTNPHVA